MAVVNARTFSQQDVDDYLEAAHAVGEHLLAVFAEACAAIGVGYYLTSGTLLGAVRSGGWIPWDDDIDVIMLRTDYDRFAQQVAQHLPPDVVFSSPESNEQHMTAIPRLLHTDSHRVHIGRSRKFTPIETLHVPLDIFVLDVAPAGPRARRLWSHLVYACDRAAVARCTTLSDVWHEGSISFPRRVAEMSAILVSRGLSLRGWRRLRRWLLSRPVMWGASGTLVATNYSTPGGRRMCFHEAWYDGSSSVTFEGVERPAPRDAGAVLTELYGDRYLEPPAVADRQPIHLRGGLTVALGHRSWSVLGRPVQESPSPPDAR